MKKIVYSIVTLCLAVLSSCSNTDYLNAIPAGSRLLMSIDPTQMSGVGNRMLLQTLLRATDLDNTGLDLASNIYFFEDAVGNLGLCARVADTDKIKTTLARLGEETKEHKGFAFATLPNRWIMGYSDKAALLMGPVLPSAEREVLNVMSHYLSANEEDGVVGTPLHAKLESIQAPMALVCEATALPEQFVAPFTLGAPKDADASQVLIAAEMKVEKGCLEIRGETFSFKPKVNDALQKAAQVYRPIVGTYTPSMSQSDAVGLFLNVDGTRFIDLMRQNRGLKTMLAGINTAIDMDNIIKSIDGDMALITPSMGSDKFDMMMAARLKHAEWLADVDYWKQSVPQGGIIGDWGKNCFYYRGDNTSYYFGVTDDMQYMSGGSAEAALRSTKSAEKPIGSDLQDMIKGQKLVMVVNFAALQGSKAEALFSLLKPVFGHPNAIVYTLK